MNSHDLKYIKQSAKSLQHKAPATKVELHPLYESFKDVLSSLNLWEDFQREHAAYVGAENVQAYFDKTKPSKWLLDSFRWTDTNDECEWGVADTRWDSFLKQFHVEESPTYLGFDLASSKSVPEAIPLVWEKWQREMLEKFHVRHEPFTDVMTATEVESQRKMKIRASDFRNPLLDMAVVEEEVVTRESDLQQQFADFLLKHDSFYRFRINMYREFRRMAPVGASASVVGELRSVNHAWENLFLKKPENWVHAAFDWDVEGDRKHWLDIYTAWTDHLKSVDANSEVSGDELSDSKILELQAFKKFLVDNTAFNQFIYRRFKNLKAVRHPVASTSTDGLDSSDEILKDLAMKNPANSWIADAFKWPIDHVSMWNRLHHLWISHLDRLSKPSGKNATL